MDKRLLKTISIGILVSFILGILSIKISNYIVAPKEKLSQKKSDAQYPLDITRNEKGKFEVNSLYLITGGFIIVSVAIGVFFILRRKVDES